MVFGAVFGTAKHVLLLGLRNQLPPPEKSETMSRLALDLEETVTDDETGVTFNIWDWPPAGVSFTAAFQALDKRTKQLAEMMETIVNVMGKMP